MSFQWLVDNASNLTLECRPVIASTVARSGVTRRIVRGNAVWRFIITPPETAKYSEIRKDLTNLEKDYATSAAVTLNFANNPGLAYIFAYQGDNPNPNGNILVSFTKGSTTVNYTDAGSYTGYVFRAGDYLRWGTKLYRVEADVPVGAGSFTVNRPILENTAANAAIFVGPPSSISVECVQASSFSIIPYDRIQFSGDWVFVEKIY